MSSWFNRKTRLEKLQKKYAELMKKSFRVALHDTEESERMRQRAREIYSEIQYLSLKRADK